MKNHWRNVRVFIKKQVTSYFLEKIFWLADSKYLRLRSAAFEIQFSQDGWCLPFKHPHTV